MEEYVDYFILFENYLKKKSQEHKIEDYYKDSVIFNTLFRE